MGNRARARAWTIAWLTTLVVASAGPSRAERRGPEVGVQATACVPRDQCCAVCDKGKACGDSCIARSKTCHKGRGCSCNASEVCEGE